MRKAAELYYKLTGRGARIHVYKHIPSEAGLGGGSADAAAVLRAMNRLYEELDQETLMRMALAVGADVPFCCLGGAARARGIGELLEPFTMERPLHLVIVKPARGVSTKELFSQLQLPCVQPDTLHAMAAMAKGDVNTLAGLLVNSLEIPAVACVPEIEILRNALLENGALGARMTGSGSSVFGLFEGEQQANAAAEAMSFHPACAFSRAVKTI